MGSSSAHSRWETNQKRQYKKYPKHVHFGKKDEIVSLCDEYLSSSKLPSFEPSEVANLRGQQLQNNDLFPFSLEESLEEEAFFAAFNDSGDEGTNLRELDRDGFNDIITCPGLSRQNKNLPSETFEQRAKKRGRECGALQLALRLFCRNYEQHYGSLVSQRLVDFPPILASSNAKLAKSESKESAGRDPFQWTRLNALFRDEQFEYERGNPNANSTSSEMQPESEELHVPIIDSSDWNGARNANKEIEGISLQRLLWKVLVMASKRVEQGGDGSPQSLEEQFVQKQWDSVATCRAEELQHRSGIQNLVFEYISCLLGEDYQLGPSFSGRIYDYSVDPGSIRMLDGLASAAQPTTIDNSLREKTLFPIAMRILYLFSDTSDNNANETRDTKAAEANETISPSEERIKHFKKQRDFLRKTTPGRKSKSKYLSFKEVVKPVRAALSVDEAALDINLMSTTLSVENSRETKHYDLDYDQIWAFSRELPTYAKVRNYFSLNFYDGALREGIDDPWDEEVDYGIDAQMADLTENYNHLPLDANVNPHSVPYIAPPKPPKPAQVWPYGLSDDDPSAEVGNGQIMPLPLIDFDPETLQAEQMAKVKKWRIPKYYPGDSGRFPLPETGFIEAAMGAQIQRDLNEWQSKSNNCKNSFGQSTSGKLKLPNPRPIWTEAPNYPIEVISRGPGRGRQAIPLIPIDSPQSTRRPTVSVRSRRNSRKEYRRTSAINKASIRRAVDTQLRGEGSVPTANKSAPGSAPSVERGRRKALLAVYGAPPGEKLFGRRSIQFSGGEQVPDPLPAPRPKQGEHKRIETTPDTNKNPTTDRQNLTPRSRIVGTGYHHLPASDNPFPTLPIQKSYTGVNPMRAYFTENPPKIIPEPLYPWLPADRAERQREMQKGWFAARNKAKPEQNC